MPELPEVETIRKQLEGVVIGKKIIDVEVLRQKSFFGETEKVIGKKIQAVRRRGKMMVIDLSDGISLAIHLKMTGQLIYLDKKRRVYGGHPTLDWVGDLPSKHTRVVITFIDESKLFFNDMRVFGWIKVLSREEIEKIMKKMAVDFVDEKFTVKEFLKRAVGVKKAVKVWLMDQAKLGGVGNIYANDGLFLAGVMPDRKVSELSEKELKKIYQGVKKVMLRGIETGGASASNYVDLAGKGGKYQEEFWVYKRDGQECRECGEKIRKMKVGARGSFYCPKCQE